MLSIEMARAIEADRIREIEAAHERRRLLEPEEAPDEPPVATTRRSLPTPARRSIAVRTGRLAAIERPAGRMASDCCP